jgi:hypothetical protein
MIASVVSGVCVSQAVKALLRDARLFAESGELNGKERATRGVQRNQALLGEHDWISVVDNSRSASLIASETGMSYTSIALVGPYDQPTFFEGRPFEFGNVPEA